MITRPIRNLALAGFRGFSMSILADCWTVKSLTLKRFSAPNWDWSPESELYKLVKTAVLEGVLAMEMPPTLAPWPPFLRFLRALAAPDVVMHLAAAEEKMSHSPMFLLEIGPCPTQRDWSFIESNPHLLHLICSVACEKQGKIQRKESVETLALKYMICRAMLCSQSYGFWEDIVIDNP